MRRIRKKDIVAMVLCLCMLIVANPYAHMGKALAQVPDVQETVDFGVIFPESIFEIITQVNASTIEAGKEEVITVEKPESDVENIEEAEDTDDSGEPNENAGSGNDAEDADDAGSSDDTENGDDTENADSVEGSDDSDLSDDSEEATDEESLEEKMEAVLKELTEKKSYTFSWYGTEITVSYDDYEYICKLVQREAVSEDLEGRIMVANLVFNRVSDRHFPNDVISVINQKNQFSPVSSGTINQAKPKAITREAVLLAMAGVDYSQGALYFKMTNHYSKWFATLTPLFSHGSHTFYK